MGDFIQNFLKFKFSIKVKILERNLLDWSEIL